MIHTQMYADIMQEPSILTTCRKANEDTCRRIAAEYKERGLNFVYYVGRGTSANAGMYAKYLFESRLGIPFCAGAPSAVTLYGSSLKLNNSMVLAIGTRGMAQDALEVLKKANEQGCLTVAVTNNADSALAREAKYHLFCSAGQEKQKAVTKVFLSQCQVLLQLADAMGGSTSEWLDEIPELVSRTLDEYDGIKNRVGEFVSLEHCFTVSRGVNKAAAAEFALKLQETCNIGAVSYSTSDFKYGSFALIDDRAFVFVYTNRGETFSDGIELLEKLGQSCCTRIVVSPDDEALSLAEVGFRLPKGSNDFTQFFANAAFAQMFAKCLSVEKGLNPDVVRGFCAPVITL